MKLTNSNWSTFAALVASPSSPEDYNEEAVKRLMTFLDPYVIEIKGVHWKYKPVNKVELIQFENKQEQEAYDKAYDDYCKRKAELEGGDFGGYKFEILVQLLIFQKKAELIRGPTLAKRLWEAINKRGKSAVCAVKFKDTVTKITDVLMNDYNVSRDDISLIWGGRTEAQRKKNKKGQMKLTPEQREKFREMFSNDDADFLKSIGMDIESADDFLPAPTVDKDRLGIQSRVQRQDEIDRFQSDKSHYCIFTFKAGGVGLSLHQESSTRRPRESYLAPTYSAIELVQGLCRAHRITSESVTEQTIIFYANTIEVAVAQRVSQKLKCLRHVARQRETWEDTILGGDKYSISGHQIGVIGESDEEITEEEEDEQ